MNTWTDFLTLAHGSDDFKRHPLFEGGGRFVISYYKTLIKTELLQDNVLRPLQKYRSRQELPQELRELARLIPVEEITITDDPSAIFSKILSGYAAIQIDGDDSCFALIDLSDATRGLRTDNDTENEFSVVGPKVGFVEDLDINLHLIRQQIRTPHLIIKEISIGSMSHTRVAVIYIDGVTNPQHVQTVEQRLQTIDFDIIFDSSQLEQIMSDNSQTPFPLFLSTERIDRVIYGLTLGQVAIVSSASPYVLTGPTTIFDFFISPEDYYLPWILGSLFRLIRIFGVCFSILMTPAYTAVLTYHLEMIPKDMLAPIILSRNYVPFPPVLEVLFLELTIEFLREAGARLPTKVGQTLGIVGGIVIGQASVAAALTSNILLIIVALSALASFTTPIYKMSNTIRFLRFPLIILSGIWGGFGIVLGLCLIFTHLIRLTSLGNPYLAPLYPFRRKSYTDSFIRASYSKTSRRSPLLRTLSEWRYNARKANERKDIDEY
ncbi:spore germination protein [Brevibacillus choshinensis]|uniref:Spore germination protein n=1 Tax=Brevibacillus choshinensis TaxID=54911 RepID=A0ABX7FW63_BRECH|nr:spore germination protein [Brevibacillus choshinensis]QRG70095.1 spore germination protein [Brevibacillus choshinensis]